MNIKILEEMIKKARGLDPRVEFRYEEEWDSLDHIAIITSLSREFPEIVRGLDLSEANNFQKISNLLNLK